MRKSNYHLQAMSVLELVDEIKPILAGKDPQTQGAALAELLALHIAGICVPGDHNRTQAIRADLFAEICVLVSQLTELNLIFDHTMNQ